MLLKLRADATSNEDLKSWESTLMTTSMKLEKIRFLTPNKPNKQNKPRKPNQQRKRLSKRLKRSP